MQRFNKVKYVWHSGDSAASLPDWTGAGKNCHLYAPFDHLTSWSMSRPVISHSDEVTDPRAPVACSFSVPCTALHRYGPSLSPSQPSLLPDPRTLVLPPVYDHESFLDLLFDQDSSWTWAHDVWLLISKSVLNKKFLREHTSAVTLPSITFWWVNCGAEPYNQPRSISGTPLSLTATTVWC